MNPNEYCENGVIDWLDTLININYKHIIQAEMFIYGFNKYGELTEMYENKKITIIKSSLSACYRNKEIINSCLFEDGLKSIKIDEI